MNGICPRGCGYVKHLSRHMRRHHKPVIDDELRAVLNVKLRQRNMRQL